jgi:UPF0716 protein FxsA
MARLALLFIAVPILELALLIEIGRRLGTGPTLAVVIVTGLLGAWLTRRQGLGVIRQVRTEVAARRVPTDQLADGAMILVAGALLITPGLLTDAFGFFCLIPAGREVLKRAIRRRFVAAIQEGRVRVTVHRSESPVRDTPEARSPHGPDRLDGSGRSSDR